MDAACVVSVSMEEGKVKMIVKVDAEECVGCETCVPECPAEAISMVDDKAVIDQKTCNQCKACVEICPIEAIKVEE